MRQRLKEVSVGELTPEKTAAQIGSVCTWLICSSPFKTFLFVARDLRQHGLGDLFGKKVFKLEHVFKVSSKACAHLAD
jgi:hypothetical protein